jgi:long-chain acyl-CoA synthetase
VELLVALEQAWGRHLGEETGSHIYSVRELVDAIRSAPSPAGPAVRLEAGPRATPWAEMLGGDAAEDPALTSLLHPKTLWAAFLFGLLRLFSLLARWLLELRVEGREHLPGKGPFLLCPNHESYLDPLLLVSVLPFRIFRELFFVGASEYFETPLRRWLARRINVVPIDPDSNLVRAMQAGAFGLRHGKILVLFPEGERSIDGELKTFKKGAAILSTHLQVPIVPVALDGGFEVWPRGRSPQGRAPVRVQFGRPLLAPAPVRAQASAQEIEESYLRISLRVRQLVADMLAGLSKPATADAPAMD